jgi:hypothetical protein
LRKQSIDFVNKRLAAHAEKDALLEQIVCIIDERDLTSSDVSSIDPSIDRKHYSRLRQLDRSLYSIERLRALLVTLQAHKVAA